MSNVPTNLIPTRITGLPEYTGTSTLGYIPYILDGRTYKVQFGQIAAVGAVPSTRVIAAGTGLTGGGDLSENRVISIAPGGVGFDQLAVSGATAGTYGNSGNIPVVTVDSKGRVTNVETVPLVANGYVPTSRLVSAGVGLLGGGSLTDNITLSVNFYASAPQALGSATPGVSNAAARGDHVHPAVDLSDANQTQGALPLGRGGTGDALSPVAGAVVYSTGTKFALADPGIPGQVLTSAGTGEPYWQTIEGTGTVTSVAVLTGNGFAGTVNNPNTVAEITLSTTVTGLVKGNGTALSAAVAGTDYVAPGAITGSGLTMATDRLLGRTTALTGAVEQITVGSGLSLSAGVLSSTVGGTVTSVAASGGSTGLTFSGSPITTSGTLTLGGTLAVASGGTGATTAAGARTNLGAAASGANSDITSLSGITGSISTVDSITFDTATNTTPVAGQTGWNIDFGTTTRGLGNGTIILDGMDLVAYCANAEATTLARGEVVYISGSTGSRATVRRAANTSDNTSAMTIGFVKDPIAAGASGYIVTQGVVDKLNLGAYASGDIIYLGATPGTFTNVQPYAPNHVVVLGVVERANAGNGQIYVKVNNGWELNELHNVSAQTPSNGQVIIYNASTSLWQAANLTAGTNVSITNGPGSITINASDQFTGTVTSVAASGGTTGLTFSGSPITTSGTLTLGGTLAIANGGTGATTAADARTNLGLGTAAVLNAGVANGVATLDGAGTVPTSQLPAAVLGALNYQGVWNASTNTPTLTSSVGTKGYYYVVDVAGSTNLNGITDWKIGDWAVYNGTVWQKIDNTDSVTSVNGYTGAVVLSYTDVGAPSATGTGASGTWGINVTGTAANVTGTVAVANGGTGQTSYTNGQLLIGNSTGNTLTKATLTAGSGVSITNGNGSITIAATGSGGTVTSVDVSGGTTGLTTSGGPITASGTITLAGTLAVSNGGTGATSLSSGYLLKGNGTSAVSASVVYDNGTNVGIGTTSPSQLLDVNGTVKAGTSGGVSLLMADSSAIRNTATAGNTMYFDSGVGTGSTTGDFQFRSTASFTTRLYINGATGSVGVGTTSPARLFEVTATGTNIPARLGNSQGNLDIGGSDGVVVNIDTRSWAMGLQTGGTERMRITTAGLVGIGTSAPASRLDIGSGDLRFSGTGQRILGDFSNATIANRLAIQTTTASSATVIPIIPSAAGLNVGINLETDPTFTSGNVGQIVVVAGQEFRINSGNRGAGAYLPMTFYTNGSERMRITTAGLVGVGTSAPGYLLHGVQNGNAEFRVSATNVGTNSAGLTVENEGNRNWNLWANRSTDNFIIGANGRANDFLVINGSSGAMTLNVGGVSSTHQFLYNESGGEIQLVDSTGAGPILIDNSGGLARFYKVGSGAISMGTTGANYFQFITSSIERMRIDSSGNVGIGTNSPSSRLTVQGDELIIPAAGWTSGQAARLYLGDTANGIQNVNGSYQTYFAFNGHSWNVNGSEAMRIDGSRNVGIGISSPSYRLDVGTGTAVGTTAGNSISISRLSGGAGGNNVALQTTLNRISNGTDWQTTALRVQAQVDLTPFGYIDFLNGSSAAMTFGRATSEFMRIDSSGNVGIGTSAPASLLHVKQSSDAIEVYPSGTWAGRVINAADAAGFNGLMVGNRWASTNSWVVDFGSIYGGGTGSWSSYYKIDGVGQSIWGSGAAGTERMRITSAGNVGIGTSSPGAKLQINAQDGFRFDVETGAASTMRFGSASTGEATGALAFTRTTGVISLSSGSTGSALNERMRIDGSGNVAIGTTTTASRLRVAAGGTVNAPVLGNVANYPAFFSNADTGYGFGLGTNSVDGHVWLQAQRSDSAVAYNLTMQEAGGNVGIGTSTPNNKLTVVGGGVTQYKVSGDNNAFLGSTSDTSNNYLRLQNSVNTVDVTCSNGSAYLNSAQNILWFGTNGVERMRLSGSELLVGTTTGGRTVCINAADNWMRMSNPSRSWLIGPSIGSNFNIWDETGGANRFYIDSGGTAYFTGLLIGRNCASTDVNSANDTGSFSVRGSTTTVAAMSFHRVGAFAINMGLGTDAVFRIGGWSASSNCFQMDASGNLTMLGNVTAYSDARMKKDVETIGGALDLVSKMRGVRYTRTDTDKRGVGVIAQEMLEVLPEVVQQGVGDDDTLSVAYGNLVGVLIEAIKELRAEIVELKGK